MDEPIEIVAAAGNINGMFDGLLIGSVTILLLMATPVIFVIWAIKRWVK